VREVHSTNFPPTSTLNFLKNFLLDEGSHNLIAISIILLRRRNYQSLGATSFLFSKFCEEDLDESFE